jgi:hypothetical protein
MRFLRTCGAVGVGVFVGAALLSIAASASQGEKVNDSDRIFIRAAGRNTLTSEFVFIKDLRSGGCWFGLDVKDQGITTMATAPAKACDK